MSNALPASTYRGLGLLIGDSIVANTMTDATALATLTSGTPTRFVRSQAVAGNTIAQQQTLWTASDLRDRDISWWILQVGVNDAIAGTSSAAMITAWTALANDIIAHTTRAQRGVICPVLPARLASGMSAGDWTNAVALNAAILAFSRPSNVVLCTGAYAAMDDGTGALNATYDSGDHLHPSSPGAGSQKLTVEWRAVLE